MLSVPCTPLQYIYHGLLLTKSITCRGKRGKMRHAGKTGTPRFQQFQWIKWAMSEWHLKLIQRAQKWGAQCPLRDNCFEFRPKEIKNVFLLLCWLVLEDHLFRRKIQPRSQTLALWWSVCLIYRWAATTFQAQQFSHNYEICTHVLCGAKWMGQNGHSGVMG